MYCRNVRKKKRSCTLSLKVAPSKLKKNTSTIPRKTLQFHHSTPVPFRHDHKPRKLNTIPFNTVEFPSLHSESISSNPLKRFLINRMRSRYITLHASSPPRANTFAQPFGWSKTARKFQRVPPLSPWQTLQPRLF